MNRVFVNIFRTLLLVIFFVSAVQGNGQLSEPLERDLPNLLYNPSFEAPHWLHLDFTEGWDHMPGYMPGPFRKDTNAVVPGKDYEALYTNLLIGEISGPRGPGYWNDRSMISRDTDTARTGQASLKISGPAKGTTFQLGVNLKTNTEYTLTAWVKGENLTGNGISLIYQQIYPVHTELAASSWIEPGEQWQPIELSFTTPQDHIGGRVYIKWELDEEDAVWIDDIELMQKDQQVDRIIEPTIVTAPGTFQGPAYVEFNSPPAGAAIRYTLDGTEPHIYSTQYVEPIRLYGSSTVKARMFHLGHRTSDTVQAEYKIEPKFGQGVPFYPVKWDQTIDKWWQNHPYNPKSSNHIEEIVSPEPVINVAEVRDRYPNSKTAGIKEALELLPQDGGTLFFPKEHGPYVITEDYTVIRHYYTLGSQIPILRRHNIHFISDGATIRSEVESPYETSSGNTQGIFLFCSMDMVDRLTMQEPSTNFYFKNLHFDGNNVAPGMGVFRHCSEVLFDNCTFNNWKNPITGHPGAVSAASCTDNIWFRNCDFDNGKMALYLDGVHNSGFINCTFGPGIDHHAILMMTNNDMIHFSAPHRSGQYLVVSNCEFNESGYNGVIVTAAHVLVEDSTAKGVPQFFVQNARGQSNMHPYVHYSGSDLHILNNNVTDTKIFAQFCWDASGAPFNWPIYVRGNTVNNAETFVLIDPQIDYMLQWLATAHFVRISDVYIEDNTISGEPLGPVRIPAKDRGRVDNVVISNNVFHGPEDTAIVVDVEGNPFPESPEVQLKGNKIQEK